MTRIVAIKFATLIQSLPETPNGGLINVTIKTINELTAKPHKVTTAKVTNSLKLRFPEVLKDQCEFQ